MSTPGLVDNLPPQNLEAERAVLGGTLLDPECLFDISLILEPDHFYRDAHRTIYRAILEIWGQHGQVDAVMLADWLISRGKYEAIGGDEILMEIANSVPHAANVRYHAEIVKQKALSRSIIQAATTIIREGYSNLYTADQLLESAQQRVFALTEGQDNGQTYEMPKAIQIYAEVLERRRQGEICGLTTGFCDFDELLMGLRPKQLGILAGRPGDGKTSLGMDIAWHVAATNNVLLVSLEMGVEELTERLVSSIARIDSKRLRHPYLLAQMSLEENTRVMQAMGQVTQSRLRIDDCFGQTVAKISSKARRMKARDGLDFLVIDYLGKIRKPEGKANTNEKITEMIGDIKDLAGELNIPILCLHQLNRDCVKEGVRPAMHHLRDSGSIEQDAHFVALLHNQMPKNEMVGEVELILDKNRGGATGIIRLIYEKPFTRFSSISYST